MDNRFKLNDHDFTIFNHFNHALRSTTQQPKVTATQSSQEKINRVTINLLDSQQPVEASLVNLPSNSTAILQKTSQNKITNPIEKEMWSIEVQIDRLIYGQADLYKTINLDEFISILRNKPYLIERLLYKIKETLAINFSLNFPNVMEVQKIRNIIIILIIDLKTSYVSSSVLNDLLMVLESKGLKEVKVLYSEERKAHQTVQNILKSSSLDQNDIDRLKNIFTKMPHLLTWPYNPNSHEKILSYLSRCSEGQGKKYNEINKLFNNEIFNALVSLPLKQKMQILLDKDAKLFILKSGLKEEKKVILINCIKDCQREFLQKYFSIEGITNEGMKIYKRIWPRLNIDTSSEIQLPTENPIESSQLEEFKISNMPYIPLENLTAPSFFSPALTLSGDFDETTSQAKVRDPLNEGKRPIRLEMEYLIDEQARLYKKINHENFISFLKNKPYLIEQFFYELKNYETLLLFYGPYISDEHQIQKGNEVANLIINLKNSYIPSSVLDSLLMIHELRLGFSVVKGMHSEERKAHQTVQNILKSSSPDQNDSYCLKKIFTKMPHLLTWPYNPNSHEKIFSYLSRCSSEMMGKKYYVINNLMNNEIFNALVSLPLTQQMQILLDGDAESFISKSGLSQGKKVILLNCIRDCQREFLQKYFSTEDLPDELMKDYTELCARLNIPIVNLQVEEFKVSNMPYIPLETLFNESVPSPTFSVFNDLITPPKSESNKELEALIKQGNLYVERRMKELREQSQVRRRQQEEEEEETPC